MTYLDWNILMRLSDHIHQASVLSDIHHFIECNLNHYVEHVIFLHLLQELIVRFKQYHQESLSYAATIEIFVLLMQAVEQMLGGRIYDEISTLDAQQVNQLQKLILSQRDKVKEHLQRYKEQQQRNRESIQSYMQTIIKDHHKLLLVRVDLSYTKEKHGQIGLHDFYLHIQKLRQLLKDQQGCFAELKGYVLKLEQGRDKGFHAHLLFIYNGSKRQNDTFLGQAVIDKWREIVGEGAIGNNCNTVKYKQRYLQTGRLALGMLHREDKQMTDNVILLLNYFANEDKYDQSLLVSYAGMRCLSKGEYQPHGRQYQLKPESK